MEKNPFSIDYSYADYPKFEVEGSIKKSETDKFIKNESYNPEYIYEKLKNLQDSQEAIDKKTDIRNAIIELEHAKGQPGVNDAEIELYISTFENRLKKILLVEAAAILNGHGPVNTDYETATRSYKLLSKEIYGEYDKQVFFEMLGSELQYVTKYECKSREAESIKRTLLEFFDRSQIESKKEHDLLSEAEISAIKNFITKRYAEVIAVVPDTDDSVYYDANQVKDIMQSALAAGGFEALGWSIVIDPSKISVSTNSEKRTIFLPENTNRNASEIKRLILHEQEVHARRGENGNKSELKILKTGTASYAAVEEGLGVLLECAIEGNFENASYDRARYRYIAAGLAYGIDGSPRDGRSVYEILWRLLTLHNNKDGDIDQSKIEKSKNQAYGIIENAFRSTNFSTRGVIYNKLKIYYEGLVDVAKFLKTNLDDLEGAFNLIMIGKYNFTDERETETVLEATRGAKY